MKRKKYWLPTMIFGALVLSLSVTLLTIGARSPDTHSNLNAGYTGGYDRTSQTLVGPAQPLRRGSLVTDPRDDLAKQGAALFVGVGCASCHGLKGEAGVFAPAIVGTDADTLATKTTKGPGGMPAFDGLTGLDLKALAAYLQSVAKSVTPSK